INATAAHNITIGMPIIIELSKNSKKELRPQTRRTANVIHITLFIIELTPSETELLLRSSSALMRSYFALILTK
ncbi:MAG: hypothetical protein K2M48_04965, partial [Clostridiales bacterium]|nr:hypothetical protein [Clostridiales bacterium]